MTILQELTTLQTYWKTLAFFVLIIAGASIGSYKLVDRLEASEKKDISQDEKLDELTELTLRLARTVESLDDKMSIILQLYGIDTSKINRWRRLPTDVPADSAGRIQVGAEWLDLGGSPQRGFIVRAFIDSSGEYRIERRVLWDFGNKE